MRKNNYKHKPKAVQCTVADLWKGYLDMYEKDLEATKDLVDSRLAFCDDPMLAEVSSLSVAGLGEQKKRGISEALEKMEFDVRGARDDLLRTVYWTVAVGWSVIAVPTLLFRCS
jgi:hypothetical protein